MLPISIINELTDTGYKAGAPSCEAEKADEAVCNEAICDKCGYNGLIYRPFSKAGSYRAFAVCFWCNTWIEF